MKRNNKTWYARLAVAGSLAVCLVLGVSPGLLNSLNTIAQAFQLSGD